MDFNDPKVASMSYLELIINLCAMQEEFKNNFIDLMKLVFHIEDTDLKVDIEKNGSQNVYSLLIAQEKDKDTNESIWQKISASKFTKLKDLICFQNGLEVLDLGQNQDIIRTKRALAQQASLGGSPSVDDQLYSVSCVTGIDVKVIMNTWTINRFNEMLKACDRIIHYKIYRSAEMSGMVTFKNGIPVKVDEESIEDTKNIALKEDVKKVLSKYDFNEDKNKNSKFQEPLRFGNNYTFNNKNKRNKSK